MLVEWEKNEEEIYQRINIDVSNRNVDISRRIHVKVIKQICTSCYFSRKIIRFQLDEKNNRCFNIENIRI